MLEKTIELPTGLKIEVNTGLFINNCFVDAADCARFETENPSTGKPITSVARASKADIDRAVDAAVEAYEKVWQHVRASERGRLLYRLADLIERDLELFATLEALDNGKTESTARNFDIPYAIGCLRYFAGWADKIHGKVVQDSGDTLVYTRHEPFGAVGAITPFNFPMITVCTKLAPALACGNTVVLKTAEQTPLTALKFAALIKEAGFPPGVINILSGFADAGDAIARHPRLHKVAITGSNAAGRSVFKAASESNLKSVTLELGGKSPSIILADADVHQAIKWATHGVFANYGQSCVAGSRVFVEESVYDRVVEGFCEYAQQLHLGHQFDDKTTLGPLISQEQFDRVMSYIECGKKEGAKCLIGGERHGTEGFFVKPTVFVDVKEDMKIMQEEIFGPVVAIAKFRTIDEVIEKANCTKYGLAAAIFSKDINRVFEFSNRLKAGTVWVNCYNQFSCAAPFGGFKESGKGREYGKYVLHEYTQIKTVYTNLGINMS